MGVALVVVGGAGRPADVSPPGPPGRPGHVRGPSRPRKSAASAISSARPSRPIGTRSTIQPACSGGGSHRRAGRGRRSWRRDPSRACSSAAMVMVGGGPPVLATASPGHVAGGQDQPDRAEPEVDDPAAAALPIPAARPGSCQAALPRFLCDNGPRHSAGVVVASGAKANSPTLSARQHLHRPEPVGGLAVRRGRLVRAGGVGPRPRNGACPAAAIVSASSAAAAASDRSFTRDVPAGGGQPERDSPGDAPAYPKCPGPDHAAGRHRVSR